VGKSSIEKERNFVPIFGLLPGAQLVAAPDSPPWEIRWNGLNQVSNVIHQSSPAAAGAEGVGQPADKERRLISIEMTSPFVK
jgi:hypothetical protein